ncbi:SDR family oxidoreductase [Kineococcus rhizosphaerae]|uniref:Short-subunit dehydrogenase n=1 Tax=Kineococcus rhizosphaerae TaxID=559628 RepID=A0A2T0QXR3_9ACTN|nr:SDR family oxidoreductase [Kineococcus rhizosphaerae]PRY10828.1 short-subunit dehydrogenase [Kineococcus rhizosphaerae]
MKLTGTTALVTGGLRGLGAAFTAELLARGATRVYATARAGGEHDDPRVEVVRLDVNDAAAVAGLAARAGDVDVVVNNAGVSTGADLLTGPLDDVRAEFETNVFGLLQVARAFAPVLAANGGGALVDVHSVLSWATSGTGYQASKAAAWGVTNGLRALLAPQGTLVTGVHLGYTATDMTAGLDVPKNDPRDVVRAALDGVERDEHEVLADEVSRQVKTLLAGDPAGLVLPR